MLLCWSVKLCGFLIHVLNPDKVYLVVLNMFLGLQFNSLELHLQPKLDPIQFNFSGNS